MLKARGSHKTQAHEYWDIDISLKNVSLCLLVHFPTKFAVGRLFSITNLWKIQCSLISTNNIWFNFSQELLYI